MDQQTNSLEEEQNLPRISRFSFTGSGGEYFGIWIVNILLSIVTLGIYSAWAKVRNRQYFYGNTFLENSSFEYTADPKQILKGRIIAILLFIVFQLVSQYFPLIGIILALLLFIVAPWLIMKSLAFNARFSQYRNIQFSFHQNLGEAFKVFVLIPLILFAPIALLLGGGFYFLAESNASFSEFLAFLPFIAMLAFFAAYPFIVYVTNRYVVANHSFGGESFHWRLEGAKAFYMVYLKAAGIFLAFMALFAGIGIFTGITGLNNSAEISEGVIMNIVLLYIGTLVLYGALYAYVSSRIYNLIYQNTQISRHKLRANMPIKGLFLLNLTNSIGIILTLGLFIPWAKVRSAKFRADHTAIQINSDLEEFIATQAEQQNVFGEEIGEVFDLDIGI